MLICTFQRRCSSKVVVQKRFTMLMLMDLEKNSAMKYCKEYYKADAVLCN